jgi:hypothetical protein
MLRLSWTPAPSLAFTGTITSFTLRSVVMAHLQGFASDDADIGSCEQGNNM